MYLLEAMLNEMSDEKKNLARQLMWKPWKCDSMQLKKHLPTDLVKQFRKLQEQCLSFVSTNHVKNRLWNNKLRGVGFYVYVQCDDGRKVALGPMTVHTAEQFIGQATEDLASIGRSFHELPKDAQAAFLGLYASAEACLYTLLGVTTPDHGPSKMRLNNEERALRGLRLYWFGHQWAFQSDLSDMFLVEHSLRMIKLSFNSIEVAVRNKADPFKMLVNSCIDKYLSIHAGFAHLLGEKDQEKYSYLYRRVELISYLFLKSHEVLKTMNLSEYDPASVRPLPCEIDISTVLDAGFEREDVVALLEESDKEIRGDKFLSSISAERLAISNINFKYACNVYLKSTMKDMTSRGDWFDKAYIPTYLRERIGNPRFSYGAEVKSKSSEKDKYDVDLIVADYMMEKIYFCQIKHRISTRLPYLRDELKEYSTNGQLIDAVSQINGARSQLTSPKFLEKVRGALRRGGADPAFLEKIDQKFLEKSAGFIIIHTIENLDFGLRNGIALYEWNTFRNLLRGNITAFSHDSVGTVAMPSDGLPLDQPSLIAEKMMEWQSKKMPNNPLDLLVQWKNKLSSYVEVHPYWGIEFLGKTLLAYRRRSFRFPLI